LIERRGNIYNVAMALRTLVTVAMDMGDICDVAMATGTLVTVAMDTAEH